MNDVGMTIAGTTATQSRERPPEASGPAAPHDAAAVRRRWPWVLAAVIVAGFIAVVLMELYVPGGEAWTDDAYVTVHYATIAPRVAGQVASVPVDDNQLVRAGQVIATLDERDYATAVAHAAALLARDRAQVANAAAAIERQPSIIAQDRANVDAAQAKLLFARIDAKRYQYLATTGAGSVQQGQLSETTAHQDVAALDSAEASVKADTQQLDILRAQRDAAEATVHSDEAALAQARLNLSYTQIVALMDGTIAQRGVQVGDYVGPGTALMALVPLKDVYIVANYREVDLRRMRPGQHARVHVDAYDIDLDGIVDSVPPASGAAFSPIAPNNATGNFTKIVQRLPVKIVFAPDQKLARLIRVGLSVEVTVDTVSRSPPGTRPIFSSAIG
jgi:membrane fusion protein, multidrug efflux system